MGMGVSIMLTETDSRVGQIDGAAAEGLPPRTYGTSTMADFNFVILYVDSPPASGSFYADLLGKEPVEASPTFGHVRPRQRRHARPLVASHGRACGEPGRRKRDRHHRR